MGRRWEILEEITFFGQKFLQSFSDCILSWWGWGPPQFGGQHSMMGLMMAFIQHCRVSWAIPTIIIYSTFIIKQLHIFKPGSNGACLLIFFKVAHGFETAVSIFDEFTDFSLYNLLYDKEHYIGI